MAALLLRPCASTSAAPLPSGGPLRDPRIPCVRTTLVAVTPRLTEAGQHRFSRQDFLASGVVVGFASRLGVDPAYPKLTASVTHYQDSPGNDTMMRERPGDRVQLCFLGAPRRSAYCDPQKDPRGRRYRVYDPRLRAAYDGMNAEHDCGGA
ncbi:MAG: hypothetical protein ACREQC_14245 [Candidatus Binataceae bacterium]